MYYGQINGLSKPVSKIILGCSSADMRRGTNCDGLFDAALSSGVNAFDTARGYGGSERILGGWINRRSVREKVAVITKGALHGLFGNSRVNERCIRADLKKSLAELDCGRIDVYILHRDDPKAEAGRIVGLLNEFRDKGLVEVFGVSNWTYKRIIEANEYAYKHSLFPLSVSEPHFSLAEAGRWTWIGCTSVTGAENAAEREWYKNTQFPLFAFSPLGGGYLFGAVKSGDSRSVRKLSHAMRVTFDSENNRERLRRAEEIAQATGYTVAQVALGWALCQGMNTYAITGSSKIKNLEKSIAAADIRLTPEQSDYLNLK